MDKNKKKNKREIIDLTRYISPENLNFDPQGMYTGVPVEVFYDHNEELPIQAEEPIQDADDL